ncbi:hypothetical protein [Roseisolibacter sp. H3M3-2]|uniref:hypothetical protein n=1 Tax=Roseisolibacter sp. H3M3-2 TaxID=3031323 RepID=UPI0023DA2F56|nr:hypothetical protein [Roseisolibacter sp. H3M3-2]MDF1505201.1 hypothetical protein [Roseisolibacter sp. H3M3-2]
MPSTRTWLVVLASLVGVVVACGVALSVLFARAEAAGGLPSLSAVMPLRVVAVLGIAAAIACVPPLMVRSFVGGQRRAGNADAARVAWVARHEAGVVGALWLVWGAGLLVALPSLLGEMKRAGFTSLVPPADAAAPVAPGVTATVTTPGDPSATRAALLDAVRARLGVDTHFRVDHVRAAGTWAFLRATEVVPLDGGEQQETDLTVAALLSTDAAGAWQVVELWSLPDDQRLPMPEFLRRLGAYQAAAGLPAALFPDDLRPGGTP